MENEQLEIRLKTVLVEAISQFDRLTNSATNFDKIISSTNVKLDKMGNFSNMKTTVKTLDNAYKATINVSKETENVGNSIKKTSKLGDTLKQGLSSAFNVNKLYLYRNLTKRLRDTLKGVLTSAIDYKETENKFNMSMGSAKPQAVKFINQVTEAIGVGKAELMDYQSTYKNILSGLGNFTDNQSEKISKSLIKMSLDYSSLFNVERSQAMNKFQSALVGSIRPIRSDSGYDVSDTTIGAKAKELGIERSVGQLNQMEKRILRIIVLMDQLRRTGAMGDLARTIEEPANQLQVLKAQIQEVGVWLGNVFMGTVGRILPYINAFVMVIKELIKAFALFVGYKGDNSNLSDVFEVANDSVGGISSGLGDANKKAKELKKTLMSFDILNVITTPTESKSSSSGGGVGSIDPAILKSLGDYDSMMEKVRMKATDIRDRIMEWLGFTKIINPFTGEINWKLKEGVTNFERIKETVKGIGLGLATWKLSKPIMQLFFGKEKGAKIAFSLGLVLTGVTLTANGIKRILSGDINVFSILETIGGTAVGSFGLFKLLTMAGMGAGLATAISIPLVVGISASISNFGIMKDLSNGLISVEEANKRVAISSAIVKTSFAVLGAFIGGPLGAVIGALVGGLVSYIAKCAGTVTETDKLLQKSKELKDSVEETIKSYDEKTDSIKRNADEQLLEVDTVDRLNQKLAELVDENGKVKDGYEDRTSFILGQLNTALGTEYKVTDGIIENYKDMQTEIKNTIEAKKKQIQVEAYQELYAEEIKKQIKLEQDLGKAKKELNELVKTHSDVSKTNIFEMAKYNKAYDNLHESINTITKELEESEGNVEAYTESWINAQEGIYNSSTEIVRDVKNMSTDTVNSMKELSKVDTSGFVKELDKMEGSVKNSVLAQCTTLDNYKGEITEKWKDLAKNSCTEFTKAISEVEPATRGTILKSLSTTENLTPEVINAWKDLAELSYNDFSTSLSEVDTYTQGKILSAMTTTENLTPEMVRLWKKLGDDDYSSFTTAIAGLDLETEKELKEMINKIDTETPNLASSSNKAGTETNTNFKNGLGDGNSIANSFISGIANGFLSACVIGSPITGAVIGLATFLSKQFSNNAKFEAKITTVGSISTGNIGKSGTVRGYAGGGMPPIGEMFVAREAGPELVGRIGNRTAVINNQQIIQGITNGVSVGVSEALLPALKKLGSKGTRLIIDGRELRTIIKEGETRDNNLYGTT